MRGGQQHPLRRPGEEERWVERLGTARSRRPVWGACSCSPRARKCTPARRGWGSGCSTRAAPREAVPPSKHVPPARAWPRRRQRTSVRERRATPGSASPAVLSCPSSQRSPRIRGTWAAGVGRGGKGSAGLVERCACGVRVGTRVGGWVGGSLPVPEMGRRAGSAARITDAMGTTGVARTAGMTGGPAGGSAVAEKARRCGAPAGEQAGGAPAAQTHPPRKKASQARCADRWPCTYLGVAERGGCGNIRRRRLPK